MSEMSAAPLWQPPSLRVVNPAADKLTFEQELERARQQGYQEGLRQGLEEGRQQARNTLAEMSALWDAMQRQQGAQAQQPSQPQQRQQHRQQRQGGNCKG